MKEFSDCHGVTNRFSTPHFPSQNPAETFMKTIGKAMKISRYTRASETGALKETLKTYRQTPHPATGIPPANMLFRDALKHKFPRKPSSAKEISLARESDKGKKQTRQESTNSSKYRKESNIGPGDIILVRDWTRKSKFDPIFLPSPFTVLELNKEMKNVLIKEINSSRTLTRHLDDVKKINHFIDATQETQADSVKIEPAEMNAEELARQHIEKEHGEEIFPQEMTPEERIPEEMNTEEGIPEERIPEERKATPRKSSRVKKARKRYLEIC